jgi:phenylalanyl-tRNA synthetase beta chain
MKVPIDWVKEYVDIPVSTSELCRRMIMHGHGVEGVTRLFEAYDNIVVGRLLSVDKHPNADRLSVCTVEAGLASPLCVITGATNVHPGMLCPVAIEGAALPCGKTIEAGVIRDVRSEGMLLSGPELCLCEEDIAHAALDGILPLGEHFAVWIGHPFFGAAGLDTDIVEFEVAANRADCMSVLGMAREIGAALNEMVRDPVIAFAEAGEVTKKYVSIAVEDANLCPRYTARMFRDIKIMPSPLWMQRRITACGMKPINCIVDVTNYVMLEMGYPMHAFDYDRVRDGHIIVRRAKDGETLRTLDGVLRTLDREVLLIADRDGAIGLAGVMGGEGSEITDTTTAVLLEVAKFDGPGTRRTSRSLGLLSEAAARFSKGVDDQGIVTASNRAAQLYAKLGCGVPLRGLADTQTVAPEPVVVALDAKKINGVLGCDLSQSEMIEALARENIKTRNTPGGIVCVVPHYRQDVRIVEDLAEEIARIVGYDNLPVHMLTGTGTEAGLTHRQRFVEQVRQCLCGLGLHESIAISMIGSGDFDLLGYDANDPMRDCVRIVNPLGEELSLMRTTLVPSMAKALSLNARNRNADAGLFEISNVHANVWIDGLPKETTVLCIGMLGDTFLRAKGVLEAIFRRFDVALPIIVPGGGKQYHPGRKARITCGGRAVGEIGEIHPDALVKLDIGLRAVVLEIELDALYAGSNKRIAYKPLPRYPAIVRDMALTVPDGVPVGSMMEAIRQNGDPLLEEVALFDVYRGEQVQSGYKSVAFTLTLRDENRTLRDEDASALFVRVVEALEKEFCAKLRGL